MAPKLSEPGSFARRPAEVVIVTSRHMELESFVSRFVTALQPLMPAGILLNVADDDVLVCTPHSEEVLQVGHNIRLKLEDGIPADEAIQHAVMDIMNELQDIITVAFASPWPQRRFSERLEFAPIYVELHDRAIHVFFGTGDFDKDALRAVIPVSVIDDSSS